MDRAQPAQFKCEFCLRDFVSSIKSVSRTPAMACGRCRSVAAAYAMSKSTEDKHQFYLARRKPLPPNVDDAATLAKFGYLASDLGSGSVKKVAALCGFCNRMFDTSLAVANKHDMAACKRCDAVASRYFRFGNGQDRHEFWKSIQPNHDFHDVDVAATVMKFGHSPLDLNPFSTKKVVAVCAYCSDRVETRMSKYSLRAGNVACKKCVRTKTVATLKTRYGVSTTLDIPSVRAKLANPKTEQTVQSLLETAYCVSFERNFIIGPYSFDFFIPSCNLLIECQGDFFHDFKKNGYSGTSQDRAKSSYVENNTSHRLVWIWEHEIHLGRVKKILDFHVGKAIEPSMQVTLQDLSFAKIANSDAHAFLSQFHYLGNLGTVATCYGAYSGQILTAVAAFGGVTRQQSIQKVNKHLGTNFGPKQIKELRRLCIRPNVVAKNMASYCLRRFLKMCSDTFPDLRAVLSFSDPTVGDIGTIYKASNWRNLPDSPKSYHYIDSKTGKRIHKKTVWDLAKQAHMPEMKFASDTELIAVQEEPKKVWLKML